MKKERKMNYCKKRNQLCNLQCLSNLTQKSIFNKLDAIKKDELLQKNASNYVIFNAFVIWPKKYF